MFGYVTPAFEALSEEDKRIFRGYYCALCREIGKRSQPARIGLSYDMTFLAILLASLAEEAAFSERVRCALHPFKRIPIAEPSRELDYSADMSVALIKAKLADDTRDEKNPLYAAANSLICDKSCKAKREREIISQKLAELAEIERKNLHDPDLAADCFATLCGEIFAAEFLDKQVREAIYWLGYNIGRWVYLTDAYADLEHDIKKHSYNPFAEGTDAAQIREQNGERIEELLYFALSEASAAYDLLPVKRFGTLLENIIYIGLPMRQEAVLRGKERKRV